MATAKECHLHTRTMRTQHQVRSPLPVGDDKSVQGMTSSSSILINSKSLYLKFLAKVDSQFKSGRNVSQNRKIQSILNFSQDGVNTRAFCVGRKNSIHQHLTASLDGPVEFDRPVFSLFFHTSCPFASSDGGLLHKSLLISCSPSYEIHTQQNKCVNIHFFICSPRRIKTHGNCIIALSIIHLAPYFSILDQT